MRIFWFSYFKSTKENVTLSSSLREALYLESKGSKMDKPFPTFSEPLQEQEKTSYEKDSKKGFVMNIQETILK